MSLAVSPLSWWERKILAFTCYERLRVRKSESELVCFFFSVLLSLDFKEGGGGSWATAETDHGLRTDG